MKKFLFFFLTFIPYWFSAGMEPDNLVGRHHYVFNLTELANTTRSAHTAHSIINVLIEHLRIALFITERVSMCTDPDSFWISDQEEKYDPKSIWLSVLGRLIEKGLSIQKLPVTLLTDDYVYTVVYGLALFANDLGNNGQVPQLRQLKDYQKSIVQNMRAKNINTMHFFSSCSFPESSSEESKISIALKDLKEQLVKNLISFARILPILTTISPHHPIRVQIIESDDSPRANALKIILTCRPISPITFTDETYQKYYTPFLHNKPLEVSCKEYLTKTLGIYDTMSIE